MILAGEYIDQSLGAWLCISTMAAAALGNIISDVAGVGLAHYIEFFVHKLGIRHPVLTAEQVTFKFHLKITFVLAGIITSSIYSEFCPSDWPHHWMFDRNVPSIVF